MAGWKDEIKRTVTKAEDVETLLRLNEEEKKKFEAILERFPMALPPYYLSLINFEDENDPILKMALPSVRETDLDGTFDTSGEASNTVASGIQHKYESTALVLSTNRCAMYCRHCFRKRLVGQSDNEIASHFGEIVEYIKAHPEITNVILSGGDALMLSNERLRHYLDVLCTLPQLDLIRIATRIPVVLPERIYGDKVLLDMLTEYGAKKPLYMITQFNHPREMTDQAALAVSLVHKCGIVIKNQTVLLNGVNDDPAVLGELLRTLTRNNIVPYYVFQCRPVSGVKNHFQVPIKRGIEITEAAKAMQNGQGKCIKYCMSHPKGKIEIVGNLPNGETIFKFHQAKDKEDMGRVFTLQLNEDRGWLGDDLR